MGYKRKREGDSQVSDLSKQNLCTEMEKNAGASGLRWGRRSAATFWVC